MWAWRETSHSWRWRSRAGIGQQEIIVGEPPAERPGRGKQRGKLNARVVADCARTGKLLYCFYIGLELMLDIGSPWFIGLPG